MMTDEEKANVRKHARMFLRACGISVGVGDSEPIIVEIIDDDGKTVETIKK